MNRIACVAAMLIALLAVDANAGGKSGGGGGHSGGGHAGGGHARGGGSHGGSRGTSARGSGTRGSSARGSTSHRSTSHRSSHSTSARSSRGNRTSNVRRNARTTRRSSPSRGMSTRDFINRRQGSSHGTLSHGKQAQHQTQHQSAQRGHAGGQGSSRKHTGDRPTKTTTGWRQPTIGQGYAERFPGTSKIPIRNYDGSYSLNGRTYYGGSYRRGGHSGSGDDKHGGKHGYWGFYHRGHVRHAYVPYGFYGGGTTVYIDDSYLRDDYAIDRYEEELVVPDGVQAQSNDPIPAAATSAAAERYLREATALFGKKEYPEAARRFRLAAIAAPENAAPLFALGFALVPLENYPYATKVIRRAIDLDAALLNEGGDVSAVFEDQKEFARVRGLLVARIAARPDDLHAPFLLGAMQYFSGDPAATKTFQLLSGRDKNDRIVSMLASAAGRRFKAADDLPEIR